MAPRAPRDSFERSRKRRKQEPGHLRRLKAAQSSTKQLFVSSLEQPIASHSRPKRLRAAPEQHRATESNPEWSTAAQRSLKQHRAGQNVHPRYTDPVSAFPSARGLSWGCLGPSWGCLGAVLGHLGAVLGSLGAVLYWRWHWHSNRCSCASK